MSNFWYRRSTAGTNQNFLRLMCLPFEEVQWHLPWALGILVQLQLIPHWITGVINGLFHRVTRGRVIKSKKMTEVEIETERVTFIVTSWMSSALRSQIQRGQWNQLRICLIVLPQWRTSQRGGLEFSDLEGYFATHIIAVRNCHKTPLWDCFFLK